MASAVGTSAVRRKAQRHILLTFRAKNYIRKAIKLGEYFWCHPYKWDDVKGYPVFTTSRLQILGWLFNVAFTLAYFIFLLAQCIRLNWSPEVPASAKAFIIFATILFSFPVIYQATILMAQEQLTDYVRRYFRYCQHFEESYMRKRARPSLAATFGGALLTYVYYAFAVDGCFFTFHGLTNLNSPEQLSSLIPDRPIVQAPLCILFNLYFYSSYAANGNVIMFTSFGALFAFFDIMKELGKDESTVTTGAFGRPQDRIRAYRVLQLQADATDRVYWIHTAASQYVLMFIAMFCTYGAIRLDGRVGIVLGVVGASAVIILAIILSAWAEFDSGSSDALASLRTMTTRADLLADRDLRGWFRRSVKSLRVARVPVCGAYYIDKELVLNTGGIISDGIFFLLVNF